MTKIVNDILDIPCLLKVQEQFYDDWHIVTNSLSSSLSSNLSLSSSLESIVALELDDGDDDIFYDALDEFLYTSTNNHLKERNEDFTRRYVIDSISSLTDGNNNLSFEFVYTYRDDHFLSKNKEALLINEPSNNYGLKSSKDKEILLFGLSGMEIKKKDQKIPLLYQKYLFFNKPRKNITIKTNYHLSIPSTDADYNIQKKLKSY